MGDKQAIFKKIRKLMGNDEIKLPKCADDQALAVNFKTFFDEKIKEVREELEPDQQTSALLYTPLSVTEMSTTLSEFKCLQPDEVLLLIRNMNDKFCSLDPVPTWLFKRCTDILLPILTFIINESLTMGSIFPIDMKNAIVKQSLKSNDLDSELLKSYRPVSNLSFISKLLEKVVQEQLMG